MNAPLFPSILISCPCSDTVGQKATVRARDGAAAQAATAAAAQAAADADIDSDDDEGETFDPRAPRAVFSLFPLEHLLFCEDCNQIRCPRCVQEEITCYYCPSCLLEVPASAVKSEGNRHVVWFSFAGGGRELILLGFVPQVHAELLLLSNLLCSAVGHGQGRGPDAPVHPAVLALPLVDAGHWH